MYSYIDALFILCTSSTKGKAVSSPDIFLINYLSWRTPRIKKDTNYKLNDG